MNEHEVSLRKFRNINRARTKSQGMDAFTVHSSLDNYSGAFIRNSNLAASIQQPYSQKKSSEILSEQTYNQIYQQFNLQRRARDFIIKMKREKQQIQGRLFKEKEKQEKKRKQKEKIEKQYLEQREQMMLQARLEKVTQNILENRQRIKLRLLAAEKKKNINNANETLQVNLPKLQSALKMPIYNNDDVSTQNNGSRKRYLMKKCHSERQKNYMSVSLEKSKSKKTLKTKIKISRKNLQNSNINPQKNVQQNIQQGSCAQNKGQQHQ